MPSNPTMGAPMAYSIADAARVINAGTSTVYEWIGDGKLPVVKIGRRTLILEEDLRAFLARHRVAVEPKQPRRRSRRRSSTAEETPTGAPPARPRRGSERAAARSPPTASG